MAVFPSRRKGILLGNLAGALAHPDVLGLADEGIRHDPIAC